MNRKTLTISVVALGLSLTACKRADEPAEERAEARQEMDEALDDHREQVNEVKEETEAEKGKKITEANRELADKQHDAYEEVEDADENAMDRDRDPDATDKPDNDVLASRFEAYKDETKAEFQMRAQARISALEKELRGIEGKVDKAQANTLSDARTSLDEARKDLDEVVSGTEEVFDDGKAGVAVAINKARRKVERVKDDLDK